MNPPANSSYIYGSARTPIGRFNGSLSSFSAPELASIAIREAVRRSGVSPDKISDVILGNVLSAGLGQAPARQAALKGGLPVSVHTMTVNKVCGSGLEAVILADELVRSQESRFVVAGGMESMSRSPLLTQRPRKGETPAEEKPVDSMVHDGLWDSFTGQHMGEIAENLARLGKYSRKEQDTFAAQSYLHARQAQDRGFFEKEIIPVTVERDGEKIIVEKDEQPYAHDLEKIMSLPPAFVKEGGTVTAGNASTLNDGAAALVIGPYDERLHPVARIVAHASHSDEPDRFPTAPVDAIYKLISRWWPISRNEIDLFEINEAFAVTTLAVMDELGLDKSKVNVHGGAVALGHPIGSSGARILVTLLHALEMRNRKKGIAAICIGGGEALAVGVEMLH